MVHTFSCNRSNGSSSSSSVVFYTFLSIKEFSIISKACPLIFSYKVVFSALAFTSENKNATPLELEIETESFLCTPYASLTF
jgi:hypothetical protein